MLRSIQKLIGDKRKQLIFPIFLMSLDAIGSLVMYLMLYFSSFCYTPIIMNPSFSPISSVTQQSIADTVSLVLTGTRVSFSEFKGIAATESSELTSIFIHRKT